MTERTVRMLAKELAGVFYEQAGGDLFGTGPEDRERSKRFRETFPTWEHYKKGYAVGADGKVHQTHPGWVFFVDLARKRLVQMLGDPTKKHLHENIYQALIEEQTKATSPAAMEVLQRRIGNAVQIT